MLASVAEDNILQVWQFTKAAFDAREGNIDMEIDN